MQTMEKPQTYDMATVDEIRSRMNASYSEAKAALDEGQGDLLRALAIIEEKRKTEKDEEAELIDRIFSIAEEGIGAVRINLGRRYSKEIPIGLGVAGTLLAALLVGFFSEVSLEAVKREG